MQQTQNQQDRLNYSFSRPIIVIWFHLQIRAPSALAERGHMSESSSRAETIRLDRGLITSNVIRGEERKHDDDSVVMQKHEGDERECSRC